jgi:ABC-type multidrug transport system fused ATPase/permease subunit
MISAGTIRENVALGYPLESVTNEAVLNALKVANLGDFVNSLPDGIETVVGERGARLSGGQRQRLGIARAMFTRPCLLVLDEATSSLDGETEAGISESIQALHGVTTVVVIAHRLSTVKSADLVVYLSEGEIIAKGSFEEVKNKIADFDKQAKMLGI